MCPMGSQTKRQSRPRVNLKQRTLQTWPKLVFLAGSALVPGDFVQLPLGGGSCACDNLQGDCALLCWSASGRLKSAQVSVSQKSLTSRRNRLRCGLFSPIEMIESTMLRILLLSYRPSWAPPAVMRSKCQFHCLMNPPEGPDQ